jgi:hypothetical protein
MTADAAEAGPRKKHRHDLGQEDHGPVYAEGTTRGIQGLLGLWIALTAALLVYTLIQIARPADDTAAPVPAPAPAAGVTAPR